MDIEIKDFKNFEQFLAYSRQHLEAMKSWSPEQMKEYTDKVMALRETDPEFKAQYDKWTRVLEAKQKCHVTIGGTPEDKLYSQAWLALRKSIEKLEAKKKAEMEKKNGVKQPLKEKPKPAASEQDKNSNAK